MSNKPYAAATDRNRDPILEVLKQYIVDKSRLLEIGSGTGQHALYFAKHFKDIEWVTSDVTENHIMIKQWLKEAQLKNVHGPDTLKVGVDDFPKGSFGYVFTANTLHIMSWKENKSFFKLLGKRLREGSAVFIYGPFNYDGKFTSESNEAFNNQLLKQNDKSAIRNFEDVLAGMEKCGFKLLNDHKMPANNRLLVFERLPFKAK